MRENDASHDFTHVVAVAKHTATITSTWSDEDLRCAAYVCALCHELCDKKYVSDPVTAIDKLEHALCHFNVCTEYTRNIVLKVVPTISFSRRLRSGVPSTLSDQELNVYYAVSDADYLESLGATGIIRTFIYQAIHVENKHNTTLSVAREFIESHLVRVVDFIHNECVKQEALTRLERTLRICKELSVEETTNLSTYPESELVGTDGNGNVVV